MRRPRTAAALLAAFAAALACSADGPEPWWRHHEGANVLVSQTGTKDGQPLAVTVEYALERGGGGRESREVIVSSRLRSQELVRIVLLAIDGRGVLWSVEYTEDAIRELRRRVERYVGESAVDEGMSPEAMTSRSRMAAMQWIATGAGWADVLAPESEIGTCDVRVPVLGGTDRLPLIVRRMEVDGDGIPDLVATYDVEGHAARDLCPMALREVRDGDDGTLQWAHAKVTVRGKFILRGLDEQMRATSGRWTETLDVRTLDGRVRTGTEDRDLVFEFVEPR